MGAEECHGTRGAQGTSGDVLGQKAQSRTKNSNSETECCADVLGGDVVPFLVEKIGSEGSVGVCLVMSEMEDSTSKSQDGTKLIVATAAKANDFATDTVFLSGEGEGGKGRGPESSISASQGIDANGANEELDICEAKGCSIRAGGSVFAGT
jgi:hypothetical protein